MRVCVHEKGVKSTCFNKVCGMGVIFSMFQFVCVLGTQKSVETVWNGYNFHCYIPHDKAPFKFCRTSWLRNFFFKPPPRAPLLLSISGRQLFLLKRAQNTIPLCSGMVFCALFSNKTYSQMEPCDHQH